MMGRRAAIEGVALSAAGYAPANRWAEPMIQGVGGIRRAAPGAGRLTRWFARSAAAVVHAPGFTRPLWRQLVSEPCPAALFTVESPTATIGYTQMAA